MLLLIKKPLQLTIFIIQMTNYQHLNEHKLKVEINQNANSAEIESGMVLLGGLAKTTSASNQQLQVQTFNNDANNHDNYIIYVSLYKNLPDNFKKKIDVKSIQNMALMKEINTDKGHFLIVTATKDKMLKMVAQNFVNPANFSVNKDQVLISKTNVQKNQAKSPLNWKNIKTKRASRTITTTATIDLTKNNGEVVQAQMKVHVKKQRQPINIILYINGRKVGMQTAKNQEWLTFKLPINKIDYSKTINIKMIVQKYHGYFKVKPDSKLIIKTQPKNTILFGNYPNLLYKKQHLENLDILTSNGVNDDKLKGLSNIVNLLGYMGDGDLQKLKIYQTVPTKKQLKNDNLIVMGSPDKLPFIKKINNDLFFQYNYQYKYLLSNEKLSLVPHYAANIGTSQLLRSPYNPERTMMVVTGANDQATYLATLPLSQISTLKQYKNGDCLLVDSNNIGYGYRFKKNVTLSLEVAFRQFLQNKMHY